MSDNTENQPIELIDDTRHFDFTEIIRHCENGANDAMSYESRRPLYDAAISILEALNPGEFSVVPKDHVALIVVDEAREWLHQ